MQRIYAAAILLAAAIVACSGVRPPSGADVASAPPAAQTAPVFAIEPVTGALGGAFEKRIAVFGVDVYGTDNVSDAKLRHAATVVAEYLDNDEDGKADDTKIAAAMVASRAFVAMGANEDDLTQRGVFETSGLGGRAGQDLYAEETAPADGFDASLEEILHLITTAGWANAYPDAFGTEQGTELGDALDAARGGRFAEVPGSYPPDAWFTYADATCDYACQATEYLYWAVTSRLGAQQGASRCMQIAEEWPLCKPELVRTHDAQISELLSAGPHTLPGSLPDGDYRGSAD